MLKKILLSITVASTSLIAFDYDLKPKKVSENVWCFFGKLEAPSEHNGGYMSNSCYVKTEDSYILIDSGPSYNFARAAYEAMAKIEKLPVKAVLNTHDHDDHWLGNSFYKEKFNAKLIGVELQDINHKAGGTTRMHHMISKEIMKNTNIVPLDQHIKEVTTLNFGKEKFVLIPIGQAAHTAEDIFIYMPERKVLFSGDLVMNGRITSNRDGSVIGSIKALEMINDKKWETLVPGHGFDTSKTATEDFVKYFNLLKERVLKAVEDDVGIAAVTSEVKLDEFKNMPMFDELNSLNIFGAYEELEFYEGDD